MPHGVRVTVNCAMSADGKLALPGGQPLRLSSEEDFARVHRMRHEHDAILVGIGTVLADDPSLTVKEKYVQNPRHPLRVVLDSRLRTPRDARVLDGKAPTLLATTEAHTRPVDGADVLACGNDRIDLARLLEELHKRGVRSLMVEGGGTTIHAFLRAHLVDHLTVYVAPRIIGGNAPTLADGPGAISEADVLGLTLESAEPLGEGVLLRWRPPL